MQSVSKPELCEENLLINELIREYLQFNQYKYTDSVLVAESNVLALAGFYPVRSGEASP